MAGQQKGQWVDINTVVSAFIDENETSEAKRFKFFQLAFRGMEQLGLDFFYSVRSVKLPINANLTATIPEGCIRVLKVGVFDANGEMVNFKKNGNISNYKSMSPDRRDIDTVELSYDFYSGVEAFAFTNYYSEGYYGNYPYSRRAAFFGGEFNIDEQNGVILLNNSSIYDYVVIECVMTPEMNGIYYVPIQFKQPLISFMDWKALPKSAKGSGQWRTLRSDYYNERRLGHARYIAFTTSNIYDVN